MKDIVTIGIVTAANLNMKKDVFFSRRDFLKTTGSAIAVTLMVACGADGLQTPVPNSNNNGGTKEIVPTPDLLPKVESISSQDVDVLFKGHEEEYAQLGVSREDVTGGYFEGSFLFHFVDKNGFDYFYLNRGSTAEPKNTFEPLDFGIDQNGNYYLGPKLSTYGKLKPKPDQIKEYFIWNPNKETVNGELLITYQTDGISDTALEYRLPNQNPIKQHLEGRAKIRQESPEPVLPAEAVKSAQEYFGENFEITPDGKVIDKTLGKEIPGFTIVPFDENRMINRGSRTQEPPTWALQRVYEFEDQKDFTVYLTEYDLKREDTKIIGYGWVYENGEFTRKQVEFNTQNPNRKVYIEGYSPEEIQYMIIKNNSDNPSYSHDGYKAYQDLTSIIPVSVVDKALFITYEGMWEPMDYNITGWGHNIIPVNKDGKWELVATSEYGLFPEFKDRNKALIIWHDKNDKKVVYAVDGKYLDIPYMFNGYWKSNDPRNPFGT